MHPVAQSALPLSKDRSQGQWVLPLSHALTDRTVFTFSSLQMHGNWPFPAFHTFSESLPPHLLLTGIMNVLWTCALMCNGDNKREF